MQPCAKNREGHDTFGSRCSSGHSQSPAKPGARARARARAHACTRLLACLLAFASMSRFSPGLFSCTHLVVAYLLTSCRGGNRPFQIPPPRARLQPASARAAPGKRVRPTREYAGPAFERERRWDEWHRVRSEYDRPDGSELGQPAGDLASCTPGHPSLSSQRHAHRGRRRWRQRLRRWRRRW